MASILKSMYSADIIYPTIRHAYVKELVNNNILGDIHDSYTVLEASKVIRSLPLKSKYYYKILFEILFRVSKNEKIRMDVHNLVLIFNVTLMLPPKFLRLLIENYEEVFT